MPTQQWFVHIHGETFGPLSNELIVLMLKQNRLQFSDFVWCDGLGKWMRIAELHQFSPLMPRYPKIPPPSKSDIRATPNEVVQIEPEVKPGTEKGWVRRYPRVPIDAKFISIEYGTLAVCNISEGGLYVKTDRVPVPVGAKLIFRVEAPVFPQTLNMSGIVVRIGSTGETPGFGVEFTKLTDEQRRVLQAYIMSLPEAR